MDLALNFIKIYIGFMFLMGVIVLAVILTGYLIKLAVDLCYEILFKED